MNSHGPFTSIGAPNPDTIQPTQKRKLYAGGSVGVSGSKVDGPGPSKRAKHPAYLLPDLSHIVALCDERIPLHCEQVVCCVSTVALSQVHVAGAIVGAV